jgi:DNA polymerase-4
VPAGEELSFLHPMPVRRLWGVGEATLAGLEALGIHTVGELAQTPAATLEARVGRSLGRHLHELANARDPRPVESGDGAKSISVEATYEQDLLAADEIEKALLRHCDHLSARLRRSGMAGHTVSLKLRFGDFATVTRSVTSAVPVEHTPDLWDAARGLLQRIEVADRGVRLLGVSAMGLVPSSDPRQLSLEHPERLAAAEAAEAVRARFGDEAVVPARLVDPPQTDADDPPVPQLPPPG